MRNWVKTTLFVSAFSPVLLSIGLARWWECRLLTADVLYYLVGGVAGCVVCLVIMSVIRKQGELITFTAKKIESNDALMLGVFVSYFLPFVAKASDITIGAVAVFFAFGGLVLSMTSSLLPHPLLRLFRYRFYKIESDKGVVYTLITCRDLADPTEVAQVRQISSSMLMEQ